MLVLVIPMMQERDAFIAPEPNNAIGFDEDTCRWIVPEVDIETLAK
jgi:hypothetical protein